jgi:hypothetical protein
MRGLFRAVKLGMAANDCFKLFTILLRKANTDHRTYKVAPFPYLGVHSLLATLRRLHILSVPRNYDLLKKVV